MTEVREPTTTSLQSSFDSCKSKICITMQTLFTSCIYSKMTWVEKPLLHLFARRCEKLK
jgi:hypothetical protein